MATEPLAYKDYVVGWLCALPEERTAAIAMLDQRHASLPRLPNDENTYSLGSIGNHNVVIALLPLPPPSNYRDEPNTAIAVTQMINTFPSIRVGLMVGLGRGIPPTAGLGDVVVGTPTDRHPGVIKWQLNRHDIADCIRTGSLNRPPSFLLDAVAKMRSEHKLIGSKMPDYLKEMVSRYPRLATKYLRSKPIRVHYGLIASYYEDGSSVAWRAQVRDKFGPDVLCVEKVALGLMENFPCIVVRGIVRHTTRDMFDRYSEQRNSKDWQEAAVTVAARAAAFAKELLAYVRPSDIDGAKTAKDILDVSSTVSSIRDGVTRTRHRLVMKDDTVILDWFTSTDHGPQQFDNLRRCQPGTGQWLLNSNEYQDWVNTPNKTLFCPGIPGAGKTILTSIIVDDLERRFRHDSNSVTVTYIYCDYKRRSEQTAESLLSSLLRQLSQSQLELPIGLDDVYDKRRPKPSLGKISSLLTKIVANQKSRFFIIVDALDECQAAGGCRARFLSAIFQLQANTGANVLATSRIVPEIAEQFKGSPSIEIRASKGDIRQYLCGRIPELPRSIAGQPVLREEITARIAEAVDGSFLLAQLHFASLIGKDSPEAIRKELQELVTGPEAYDIVYKHAMERIDDQPQEQAHRAKLLLSWIIFAKRPLTVIELQHALAVKPGELGLDQENLPRLADILQACAGLVTFTRGSNVVRLVHYTAQDYLVRSLSTWFPGDAQSYITTICTTYLSYQEFASGYAETDEDYEERIRCYPFYKYAACYWGDHGRDLSTRDWSTCRQDMLSFLRKKGQVEASSQALIAENRHTYEDYSQLIPKQMTGLHLAAYFGLDKIITTMLTDYDADVRDSYEWTALLWAAENGHEAVVKLLLATEKVDPNSQGFPHDPDLLEDPPDCDWTPLLASVENGHEAVVKLLLATGKVNPDSEGGYRGFTPLLLAAANGHDAVVRLLLATKQVKLDSKDHRDRTPLSRAAQGGHLAVVKLLLATGNVDPNPDPEFGGHEGVPLTWAASHGHEAVVKLLLFAEVNPDPAGNYCPRTPLLWAAAKGQWAIVKLLLSTGRVNPHSLDDDGLTPLIHAVKDGHEAIFKLLLATEGVDLDWTGIYGATPLAWIALRGREDMARLLLDTKKCNLDSLDRLRMTPLIRAAIGGYEAIVQLLVATEKVNLNAADKTGRTALSWTAQMGHEGVVKLLLATGKANPNLTDKHGRTPLLVAIENGREAVIKVLLATENVDPDLANGNGQTPLFQAVEFEYEFVVKLLLAAKVDPNSADNSGRTPLMLAAEKGHEGLVKLLLAVEKVDLDVADESGRTPLSWAAETGSEAVAKLLLGTGKVNPESLDINGQTPLFQAARCGCEAVAKLLLVQKANPHLTDNYGQTPLFVAVGNGHEGVVKLLGATGKVDLADNSGRTPLSWAAENGHETTVKLLLATGKVNIDSKDSYGQTPLLKAVKKKHGAVVSLLLTEGAKPNLADKHGWTPLWWAVERLSESIAEMLLAVETIDPDIADGYGQTPLSWAAENGHATTVKLLLATGKVNPHAPDEDGQTPLGWALANGHGDVAELLLNP